MANSLNHGTEWPARSSGKGEKIGSSRDIKAKRIWDLGKGG